MQICQLTAADAERVRDPGFVPDCHSHKHLSKQDAHQAATDGKVRFVSPRAVVAMSSVSLSGYWYDEVAKKDDRRYLGTAKSGTAQTGWARTHQLVNFMPHGMKHRVRDIGACGARQRRMSAAVINGQQGSFVDLANDDDDSLARDCMRQGV